MSQFPLGRILDFISRVYPFDTLDGQELSLVVNQMELAYYPRGQIIIQAGGEPAENLFIIHSGSVRVAVPSETGEDFLIDVRGEGDIFGAVSLLQSRQALFSVTAQEDLLTFLLPGAEFKRLIRDHKEFERHFSLSLARNIRAAYEASPSHPGRIYGVDSFREMAAQMRGRVSELMSANVLTCDVETTIRQAAVEMTRREVGSIVITNGSGLPVGLVTDTDLRSRVLARGLSPDAKVEEVMSLPPLKISHKAFAFEAMLEMTRLGVHHLLVTEDDRMVGVISDHDIKVVTGSTPVGLVREIEKADSLSELSRYPVRIKRILESLVSLGSSAEYMMDLLNEFVDRLYLKLFVLCENQMAKDGLGSAPVHFSWFALGRAGREEQAPPLMQDHALVYADVDPEREGVVREWFIGFLRRINDVMKQWQMSGDNGNGVVGGPDWCRSASAWNRIYRDWIQNPANIKGLADPGMVFDFRALQGESAYVNSLRELLWKDIGDNPSFLRHLAEMESEKRPPLGFFRDLVVEKDGGYSKWLDLDTQGLSLLSGAVRVLALEHRIAETNTLERLKKVSEIIPMDGRLVDDLQEAFNFLTVLWISRYLESGETHCTAGCTVSPADLNMMQRKMLKESFGVISQLQDQLRRQYGLAEDNC